MIPEWLNIPIPIATFIAGFILSRFTLTRDQKAKLDQEYYKNSQELKRGHEQIYKDYTSAISAYATSSTEPDFNLFVEIAVTGDRYFGSVNNIAEAILSRKVDHETTRGTFIPAVCRATSSTLPRHYEVLREIAEKRGFLYAGELDRSEHSAAFAVLEKFGSAAGEPGSTLADRLKTS